MKRSTTFTRGTGCYSCRVCDRRTRDDGNGDSCGVRLCTQCYELAGYENMVCDGQELSGTDVNTIKALVAFLQTKAANVGQWTHSFQAVLA